MVNFDRVSDSDSSVRVGRWEISTYFSLIRGRPLYDDHEMTGALRPRQLLAVELDDQLLLYLGVDRLPHGQRVHQDLELARDRLQPGRNRTAAGEALGHHERGELAALLAHLDDVVLTHPVRRDVDLLAVHQEVTVAHQLTGGVAGRRVAGPVDHV